MLFNKECNMDKTFFNYIENWQMKPSDYTYTQVKTTIVKFTTQMQSELLREKEDYISKTEIENKRHTDALNSYKQTYLTVPNDKAQSEFQNIIRNLNNRWSAASGIKTVRNKELTESGFSFIEGTLIESISASRVRNHNADKLASFDRRREEIRSLEFSVEQVMKDTIEKARAVKDAKIKYNSRIYEDYAKQENQKHTENIRIIEENHKNRNSSIVNEYEQEFIKYFNTTTFSTASSVALATLRPSQGYTCKNTVPDLLYLGTRTFTINSSKEDFFPEIVNMFRSISSKGISVSGNQIKITLPYCRTLAEGFSIFVENTNSNTDFCHQIVKSYVLKMLMNFPAGQTRPTLLDNDSSSALTMFATIGESSGRGLITRPWVKESDISNELSKVADERSNLSISYGENIDSRLEREPIYFVTGRNFPKGFNYDAIKSLSTIFLAGAKNGFFGLLQANKFELNEKMKDHEWKSLITQIQKNSLHLSDDNGIIKETNSNDIFEFDLMNEAITNSKDIISVLIRGVSMYRRQVEKFEYLFSKDAGNVEGTDANDMNSWYRGNANVHFEIPIGISGASTVQKYKIGDVAQHALISGVTGSGKSSLLRTMIVSTMMKYSPDNVNLYLIDFKEGVEFEKFSRYRLPWMKVIALNTEREFALNVLKDLKAEFEARAKIMSKHSSTDIGVLNNTSYPRIILFFDEVQELLRTDDKIAQECIKILSTLVSEGRAMNINVILTSQDFTNCKGIEQLMANMVIRIAFKGSPASAKKIMGDDFSIGQLEQGDSGYAAMNSASGAKGKTNYFQAGYLDTENFESILSKLQMTMANKDCKTRVMSRYASQDRNNKFNKLICNEEVEYLNDSTAYDLMIGDAFNLSRNKSITISPKFGDNIVIVGEEEYIAKSIASLTILSVLYDELASKAKRIDNELVRIIDLSDEDEDEAEFFSYLADTFENQISHSNLSNYEEMINDTFENLRDRQLGKYDKNERLFLLFFGVDNAMSLYQDMYDEDDENTVSITKKLETIIKEGPDNGINSIFWTHNYGRLKRIVNNTTLMKCFKKVLFFGDNEEDCDSLIHKVPNESVKENKAVMFMDRDRVSVSVFRPYEIPDRDWIETIADTYKNFERRMANEGD